MAEFAIIVVPQNPNLVPTSSAVESTRVLMAEFFPDRGDDIRANTSDTPLLVTTWSAFESVNCPCCGETIELFDLEEDDDGKTWWHRFEEQIEISPNPLNEAIKMPCCQAELKAGELDLGDQAAFSRFTLTLRDPGDIIDVSPEQRSALEKTLGCPVKTMVRVYD